MLCSVLSGAIFRPNLQKIFQIGQRQLLTCKELEHIVVDY